MRDLHEMTIGQRIILTLVIVLIILFALALFGYFSGRWDEAGAQVVAEPPTSQWDGDILKLDREALDEAYRDQLSRLFSVWMKDEAGQPRRMINGARQARHAYIEVMRAIEAREHEFQHRQSPR
jgi:hypothetical protein